MAVAVSNTPGWGAGPITGDQSVSLASHATGDRIYVVAAWKPYTVTAAISVASGWTELYQGADGSVASAANVGSVRLGIWYKTATSGAETNPTIDFSGTIIGFYTHYVLTKGGSESWSTPVVFAPLAINGTGETRNVGADTDVLSGAIVMALMGIRDDTTITHTLSIFTDDGSPAITWNGNGVEAPTNQATTTSGDDASADAGYRRVTTGDTGVRINFNYALSTTETGNLAVWVQNVFTPETHSGSVTGTGGGVATVTAAKKGLVSVTATGGGVSTNVITTNRQVSATGTGGGTATCSSSSNHNCAVTGTGGGVATVTQTTARNGDSVTGTASGTATVSVSKGGQASVSGTGGGTATTTYAPGHTGSATGTGGGLASVSVRTDRFAELEGSGGGTCTVTGTHGSAASISATGGGVAVLSGSKQALSSVVATGGGTVTIEYEVATSGAAGSVTATGGGSATVSFTASHRASVVASASGSATVTHRGEHFATIVVTGGGVATIEYVDYDPTFRELAEAWFTDDPPSLATLRAAALGTGFNEVFTRRGYRKMLRVSTDPNGLTTVTVVTPLRGIQKMA